MNNDFLENIHTVTNTISNEKTIRGEHTPSGNSYEIHYSVMDNNIYSHILYGDKMFFINSDGSDFKKIDCSNTSRLEVDKDLFEKIASLLNNTTFDPRILLEIDIDSEFVFLMERLSETKGVLVDDLICDILREFIKASEDDDDYDSVIEKVGKTFFSQIKNLGR